MVSFSFVRLYGILDLGYVAPDQVIGTCIKMLEGKIDILQLRGKNRSSEEILSIAKEIAPLCRASQTPFIINDDPEIARAVDASGVHIGQEDGSLSDARKIVGPNKWVGRSTHSLEQALLAQEEGADYIGFGPLFATPTKPDYTPIGLSEIQEVHRRLSIPIFCIGGIKRENLPEIISAGTRRAVIVSGILQAEDIPQYIRDCKSLLAH